MAIGAGTFSAFGGAVNDLFAGFGATTKADMTASGQRITASGTRIAAAGTRTTAAGTRTTAEGTRITAAGTRTTAQGTRITAAGTRIGADSTDLSAEGLRIKAGGDIAEANNYDLAAGLARQNEGFTGASTRIQMAQQQRQVTQTIGSQRAAVASGGFASSGSALDLLRSSASQGALSRGVLASQGAITEAGYEEQAKSFDTMSAAGRATAAGEMDIAFKTNQIANQQRGVADQQDVLAGSQDQIAASQDRLAGSQDQIAVSQDQIAASQDQIAGQQDVLAQQTEQAGKQEATGDFISSAIKGVAAIASIGLAPFTGGLSLLGLGAVVPTSGSAAP